MLSGFVLARSYSDTRWTGKSLLRYGAGRFARVYPVYVLSLAVVAPFILADHTPGKAPLWPRTACCCRAGSAICR